MKILEVGAGTVSTTETVLEALTCLDGKAMLSPRYSQYDFTDVSLSFLANAQEDIQGQKRMRFAALDVERGPREQGFEPKIYDMIIAASVSLLPKCLFQKLIFVLSVLHPNTCLPFHRMLV